MFESDPGMPIIDNVMVYNDASNRKELVDEGHNEIDNRVAAAADNINDGEPVEGDTPEEDPEEDSDSTFFPGDDTTDDEDIQPDISEVDSQDFEFNLANVHEINDDNTSRSTDASS